MKSTYNLLTESDCISRTAPAATYNTGLYNEDLMEFATIDGGVLDYYSCEQAVNDGAGIFIGGYFVGGTDASQCYAQQTFLRK